MAAPQILQVTVAAAQAVALVGMPRGTYYFGRSYDCRGHRAQIKRQL